MQKMIKPAQSMRRKSHKGRKRPIRAAPSTDFNPYRPPVEDKAHTIGSRRGLKKLAKKLNSDSPKDRRKALWELSGLVKQYKSYRPEVAREALRKLWENPSIMTNCVLIDLGARGDDWRTWENLQRNNSKSSIVAFALALPSTLYLGCAAPESITGDITSLVSMTSIVFLMFANASKIALLSHTNSFLDSILMRNRRKTG